MNFKEQQIADYNRYYKEACEMQEGLIIVDVYVPKRLNIFQKSRAYKAISLFEKALEIYPESFQCLFFIGKLYQRLREYEKSLKYIEASMMYEQENHNLPQEASIVAMNLGQIDKAIEYSQESLRRMPDNIALMGNHSMNLLIAGRDEEALKTIEQALSIDPGDKINQYIKSKIIGVISGKEVRPTPENALM